jgi:hypothetical protein
VNWLGLSVRSLLGIALGVVVGLLLFVHAYPSVVLVGVCTGSGCALLAEDRSGLRGISVATVATWAAAAVDARRLGVSTFAISSTLTPARWVAFLACIGAAFLIGSATVRRAARTRTAGT